MSLFQKYLNYAKKRPFLSKIWTTCLLFGVGDFIAQGIEIYKSNNSNIIIENESQLQNLISTKEIKESIESTNQQIQIQNQSQNQSQSFSVARLIRFSIIGLIFAGPYFHNSFKLVDKINFRNKFTTIIAKVSIDQTIGAPIFVFCFLSLSSLLAGKNIKETEERLKLLLWPTLKMNWTVWPFVQLFNFTLLKPEQRILFVNIIGVGWRTYLSMITNKNK
eukprot:TRINITY_DN803_c0_g6_i1.p1 TRINITY_DN803_c0_g6~~TRINITY_DN803_c0_g6_i1.p1  ORF type:complete len:220 (-),score=80.09 TRINITY_DN803_c0_g6_i1:28-687(-)